MLKLLAPLAIALLGLGYYASAKTALDHDKIMGCYFGSWAFYRPGWGSIDIDDIDPTLCTHGFYGFADLDNITWTIYPYDPWYDLAPSDCDPGYCNYDSYRRFVALKDRNPNFIPMLSIGGWNAGSGKYSLMARDPVKRKTFVDSVVPFVLKYGFEGVDLDWEHPGYREGADIEEDRENFSQLAIELNDALRAAGLLFTAALSPGYDKIDDAYNVPLLVQLMDFLNIMCYDYHGYWDDDLGNNTEYTAHNAPLITRPEEDIVGHPGFFYDTYDTINLYLSLGAPPEKLVLGMPTYGRGWQIVNNDENGVYCPADDGLPMGPYTLQKGTWGYNELLLAFNNDTLWNLPEATPHSWEVVVDDCYKAPYAVNGPYWIGYDDVDSVTWKTKFANALNLGGAMIWSLETCDFTGMSSSTTYPMLRAINDVLASGETFMPDHNCQGTAPMCDSFGVETTTTTTTQATTTTTSGSLPNTCEYHNQILPYPGDCHKYYRCIEQDDGSFDIQIFDCGDWVFDPNTKACVDPNLPGNENICQDP